MAARKKSKEATPRARTKKAKEVFLIARGPDKKFWVAGYARRVPDELTDKINAYQSKAGDDVFESPRAFVVCVDCEDTVELVLGGQLKWVLASKS